MVDEDERGVFRCKRFTGADWLGHDILLHNERVSCRSCRGGCSKDCRGGAERGGLKELTAFHFGLPGASDGPLWCVRAAMLGRDARGHSCWTIGREAAKIGTQRPMQWTIERPMLDLNDFFYFVQVVDRAGFAAAARTLRVPKSTLSHRLQQLETNLGVRLLNRTSRRFALTDAGEEFYRHATAMLREAELAETVIRHRLSEPIGTVR
jgi:hypothetical protein